MRSPCRDSEHCTVDEHELNIFVIVIDALEHGITVLTGLTCCLAKTFPCSLIVVRNVPIITLDLKLRCDTIGTCSTVFSVDSLRENLIALAVKEVRTIDSPVPATVLGLFNSYYWSMSGCSCLTLLTVVDLHATALGEHDLISDGLAAFYDRGDAVDIVIVLHHIDDRLQRCDVGIHRIAERVDACIDVVQFIIDVVDLLLEHVRTSYASEKKRTHY